MKHKTKPERTTRVTVTKTQLARVIRVLDKTLTLLGKLERMK